MIKIAIVVSTKYPALSPHYNHIQVCLAALAAAEADADAFYGPYYGNNWGNNWNNWGNNWNNWNNNWNNMYGYNGHRQMNFNNYQQGQGFQSYGKRDADAEADADVWYNHYTDSG